MTYKKHLSYLIVLLILGFNSKSQTWEVGLSGGGASYIGDLNPINPLKISGISAGSFLKANLDPYWSLGLHYQYGKIKADDAKSFNSQFRERNLSFYTPLNEVSLQVDFNFLEYFAGGGSKNFSPYIFAGIGGLIFSPRAKVLDTIYRLNNYRTEGQFTPYRNYTIILPYGVGLRFKVKENWGLFSQIGYRTAFTDYLDDVSGRYPTMASLSSEVDRIKLSDRSGEINNLVKKVVPGTQRGDLRRRDTYTFLNIGISYTFTSSKCYVF